MTRRRNNAGMTLLEYLLAVSLLSLVVGTLLSTSRDLVRSRTTITTRANMMRMGEEALAEIVSDLRLSGFVPGGGVNPDYPIIGTGGGAITFLLPADQDEDGVPDLDIDGSLLFDPSDFGYVLSVVPSETTGQLERWVDGALSRTIASDVEQLRFLTTSDDPSIPLDALRVLISFRATDSNGLPHSHQVETLVRLRNSSRE